MNFNITRAAHAEILVSDLGRSRHFYVEALGMLEIERGHDCIYLGGLEERDKYSLILRKAESAGLGHMAFRVAETDDLNKIFKACEGKNLPRSWIPANYLENGQGVALRIQDPSGLPIEFYHDIEQRKRQLRNYDRYHGANIMRIDHFNVQVSEVHAAYEWWTKTLDFQCSEYIVSKEDTNKLWGAWLHRKQNVHDIAIMSGVGPRFHHVGFWVQNELSIIHACDILASMGMSKSIERGPGRHGLSNAFFLYLRDPDGNRIELFHGDYMITDPDFKPEKWDKTDSQMGTFWGQQAPKSWFEEASLVKNIYTADFMPIAEPVVKDRPEFVI